jgi:hypothetical protein
MNSKTFINFLVVFTLVIVAVNANIIPINVRSFFDTIPGRVALFAGILASYEILGWIPTMLLTLIGLLMIAGGIKRIAAEGFANIREKFSTDVDIIEPGHVWWDEQVLGREAVVKNRRVDTEAISN